MEIITVFSFVWCFAVSLLPKKGDATEFSDLVSESVEPQIDFVRVLQPPKLLQNNYPLHIEYFCSNPSYVKVYVEVHTDTQRNFPVYKRLILCNPSVESLKTTVRLKLARYISFRPSFFNKYSVHVHKATLKIWLVELSRKLQSFERATEKDEFNLKIVPPYQRPFRILNVCLTWYANLLDSQPYAPKCPYEEEVVSILSYPLALSGLKIGLVKTFEQYKSKVLQKLRVEELKKARFSFVFWIYIVEYCPKSRLCSIMHHATWDDKHITPFFLINRIGQLHIEMTLKNEDTLAYLTSEDFIIPKNEWIQLVITCENTTVWKMHMSKRSDENNFKTTEIILDDDVQLVIDDLKGIYYFGGSDLVNSFTGYFGDIKFFRRRVVAITNLKIPASNHSMFKLKMTERDATCQSFKNKVNFIKLQAELLYKAVIEKKSCPSIQERFTDLIKIENKLQCTLLNAPRLPKQYRFVKNSVRRWIFAKQRCNYKDMASKLVDEAYRILEREGLDGMQEIIFLLKQSSCYGNYDASFMLATIFNHGLSTEIDEPQSHSYLLSGSMNSNRLSLLSLANKHVFSLDGIPFDFEQAYVYYMSVAYLTNNDLQNHDDKDTITETVRLTDEKEVKAQTDEEGDLFLWLKHQASQGIHGAQQNIARMLYWGSQGVKRNKTTASTYYKAAAETGNAVSLYDYGVLLLKGHGVEKNVTLALEYFKKAATKKHSQSINTLGWYALVYKKNYTEAANYFEEAFKLGNSDAGHNIAHMLLSGIFPELNRVERVLAWDFLSKAALGGNFDSGLLVAKYNMIGHPKITRSPSLSTEWARYLAEQNPAVGKLLKNGVLSFRKQNWPAALVYYLMAASTGVEVANFNLAFLCEENYEYLTSFMKKECAWRHYNLSTLRSKKNSNPYAWIKMADYHYMNHNISLAASTYANAASRGDPQALFNLALMVENEDKVPDEIWRTIGISFAATRNREELLGQLYLRCRNSRQKDAYFPCMLALWRTRMKYFRIRHGFKIIGFSLAILVVFVTFLVTKFLNILRRGGLRHFSEI